MLFKYATLLTIASLVAADQTFSLTAQGGSIDSAVQASNDKLSVGSGSGTVFTLEEPSGYLRADSSYVRATPTGLVLSDKDNASKDFGVEDGHLRFNRNGSGFYACTDGDETYLSNVVCSGGDETQVQLNIGGADSSGDSNTSEDATSTSSSTAAGAKKATTSSDETTSTETSSSTEEAAATTSEATSSSSSAVPDIVAAGSDGEASATDEPSAESSAASETSEAETSAAESSVPATETSATETLLTDSDSTSDSETASSSASATDASSVSADAGVGKVTVGLTGLAGLVALMI